MKDHDGKAFRNAIEVVPTAMNSSLAFSVIRAAVGECWTVTLGRDAGEHQGTQRQAKMKNEITAMGVE